MQARAVRNVARVREGGESVEADGILLGVDAVVEGETGSAARRWLRWPRPDDLTLMIFPGRCCVARASILVSAA